MDLLKHQNLFTSFSSLYVRHVISLLSKKYKQRHTIILKYTKIPFQNSNSVTTIYGFWYCAFCKDFYGVYIENYFTEERVQNTSQLNCAEIPIQTGSVTLGRLH